MILEYYIKFTNSHFKVHVIEAQQHTVYDCFLAITADLSSCNRDSTAQEGHKASNIYCLALYGKSLRPCFCPLYYIASYKAFLTYFPQAGINLSLLCICMAFVPLL